MGVVFFPSRVTGFSAMSRRQMMTFIEGRHLRENSSQRATSFGPACRFTLTMTCFVSDIDPRPTPAASTSPRRTGADADRKSTRLNSSHDQISYAVFCLKKKKNTKKEA